MGKNNNEGTGKVEKKQSKTQTGEQDSYMEGGDPGRYLNSGLCSKKPKTGIQAKREWLAKRRPDQYSQGDENDAYNLDDSQVNQAYAEIYRAHTGNNPLSFSRMEGGVEKVFSNGVGMKEEESNCDYMERLVEYFSNQLGLLASYQNEIKKDRYMATHDLAKKLLSGVADDEELQEMLNFIQFLNQEIQGYKDNYPHLSNRTKVRKKIKDLEKLS